MSESPKRPDAAAVTILQPESRPDTVAKATAPAPTPAEAPKVPFKSSGPAAEGAAEAWSPRRHLIVGFVSLAVLLGGFGIWSVATNIAGAVIASATPFSLKSTSVHPVNRFSLFHTLSPWRSKTIFFITVRLRFPVRRAPRSPDAGIR